MQKTLWEPESDYMPTPVHELPSWKEAKRICVDIETYDPLLKQVGPSVRHGGHIAGVSFAIEDGPAYYLPMRHKAGGNLPEGQVLAYLRKQAQEFKGEIVGANLSYDLDYLAEEGVWFEHVKFLDIQVAAPLIYEHYMSYSLQKIAERLGLAGKDEGLLREAAEHFKLNPKSDMHMLHSKYVGPYAIEDARLPLEVMRAQEKEIESQSLNGIFDLECQVLPLLVKIRRRGVAVDLDRLEEVEIWTRNEEDKSLIEIKHLTGIKIESSDVWKSGALAPALESLGKKLPLTPKSGKPKIDKQLLKDMKHPVADAILQAREMNKLRTTFAASIRTHLTKEGRIHCTFNQLRKQKADGGAGGTISGRLSATHPNMQQQPSRGDFAKFWRSIYIPDEGALWAANDYSQQEPRVLTHFAELVGCSKAEAAAEVYRTDPKADNHQMMADLTGLPRKAAKQVYLGLCYGMGGAKLAEELGLPTKLKKNRQGKNIRVAGDEAQAILNTFNDKAPFVSQLARRVEAAAQKGYIKTLLGRRCHFPMDENGNYDWTYKALNRLIQGSAADQTKKAMVDLEKAGFEIQLQVHDEVCFSTESREHAEEAAVIMENCVTMTVPSRVDVEVGPNWGEAK